MPAKSTTKETTAKEVTVVTALIEKRHYSPEGKRLSPPPFEQQYTPQEWKQFQETGPKLGYFVIEVKSAPDGVDTSYSEMSPK